MDNNLTEEEIKKRLEEVKKNCLFCKISRKEIDAFIVYEDEEIMAILDINPVNTGHTLIFPKEHYIVSAQVPDKVFAKMSILAKTISHALLKMGFKATNIFIANGAIAGQKIGHTMIHVFPRTKDDKVNIDLSPREIDKEEMAKVMEKIKSVINNYV